MTEGKDLSYKQKKAIAAIMDGKSKKQAALEAGVSYVTVYRWYKLPRFRAELQKAGNTAIANATDRLSGTMDEIVSIWLEIGFDKSKSPSIRLRALNNAMAHYLKLVEIREFGDRLTDLERIVRN